MAVGDALLLLEIKEFKDPQHWRWVLNDNRGKFLQDFPVAINIKDSNYQAFLDLDRYLKANSSPDKSLEIQTKLIRQVGTWVGKEVLGRVGEEIAKYATSITIKVVVPSEASELLYLPWEMVVAGDKPLAMRNVSLVFEIPGPKPTVNPVPMQDRLRMLAVFSLPTDQATLSLRRERYELMWLINQLAQTRGLAIDMTVLQYGTTRQSLQDALQEGEGWDMIHFSGHGDKATLILENPDGTYDPVTSQELCDLLSLAGGRLKLVTLSACLSAAATIQETREWLKLESTHSREAQACDSPGQGLMPALAVDLMAKLDCAALAMRYSVGDEFAINLTTELYRQMLEKGNTLARSLQLALQKALKDGCNAATPPLSLATPALFGSNAAELVIKPPKAPAGEIKPATAGLSYFPHEPKRFVGRTGSMGRASAAMAEESNKKGVLFHGMAGAGKTACALELAYHQRRSPRFGFFVWHQAPLEDSDISGALARLALDMETQLPGFKMSHVVDRPQEFRQWLPVLSEILEQNAVLIVLDNLENLLTTDGDWKDERWGWLVEALFNHEGLSRVILTSRKLPKDLIKNQRLIIEPINALSANEAMLLARELPNLGRLLIGKSPLGLDKGRAIVKRALSLVQGHPKLIELAEAQAGDPEALQRYLEGALDAWNESESSLNRFFQDGESARTAEEFLQVLTRWTQDTSSSLTEGARTFFRFLCALEEADRLDWIVKLVWPEFCKSLEKGGDLPDLDGVLAAVKSAGLVDPRVLGKQVKYVIHPGIAQAGLQEANEKFRVAVDSMMASFWMAIFIGARSSEDQGQGSWVIRAGLNSAPYLMRQQRWSEAAALLEQAIQLDQSPETIASVLPLLRHIARATGELVDSTVLANALLMAGRWQEAEEMLRALIPRCVAKGDLRQASVDAGYLSNLLRHTGRFEEALKLTEEKKSYTQKAGLGPWSQLVDEGQRLQALNYLGRYDEVLKAVEDLRLQMKSLPKQSDQDDTVDIWNVRESTLDTGRWAAVRSKQYDLALDLNAERIDIKKSRGATDLDLAMSQFNDYYPLLNLERYEDAAKLLWDCKETVESERSIEGLGIVFSALADLMDRAGQIEQAISFEEMALRYKYLFGDPESISISHNNLSIYLGKTGSASAPDHKLAAAIIFCQTGSGMFDSSLNGLTYDLNKFGAEALPSSFDMLCGRVERVEGVRFRELWERLPKRSIDGDKLLKELVEAARGAKQ
jgi:tetratricopeptide (TPR) repeat protein